MAVIERFPEDSAYARANGGAEILLNGNNERALFQDYVQNERQALQLVVTDMVAKVSEVSAERYPDQYRNRVAGAFGRRCSVELGPVQAQAQFQSQSTVTLPRPNLRVRT